MIQKVLTDEPVAEGRRRTPYGRIQFPVDRLAEVQFAAGPHQIDTVIGVNGDRFSGFLVDPVLTLRPQLGPTLTLRRDLVTRLALGARTSRSLSHAGRGVTRRCGWRTTMGRRCAHHLSLVMDGLTGTVNRRRSEPDRGDPQVSVISPDVALLTSEGTVAAMLTDARPGAKPRPVP